MIALYAVIANWMWNFFPLTHGCPSAGANVTNTLEQEHFLDAAYCPYADLLTGPFFAAFVLMGIVNLPIYVRTDSVRVPFVITLLIGGVLLSQTAGIMQTLTAVVVTFVVGLGPVLLLMRIQR